MFILEKYLSIDDKFATSEIMIDIVTALRLLRGGYVSGSEIIYFIETKKGDFRFSGSRISESPSMREHMVTYPLMFEDFSPLRDLINLIRQTKRGKNNYLYLAVKRFERSYHTTEIDDKLIDLIIAFEILFLKGERVQSQGSVIAVGCSMLLGKNDDERGIIRKVLLRAYTMRNHIVHGGAIDYYNETITIDKDYNVFEFFDKVENYLREAIKRLL